MKEGELTMKMNVLKASAAAIGAAAMSYFGVLAVPVMALLIAMIVDYVTGMVKAYLTAQLSSKIGVQGVLKKLCYMAMVTVGVFVDYLLQSALVQTGLDLHVELFFGLLVTIWLIINELVSILENLAAIGVPGFPRLAEMLQHLKISVENKDENEIQKRGR